MQRPSQRLTIRAPGKIIIGGEWSILIPGNSGVCAALQNYTRLTIEPNPDQTIIVSSGNAAHVFPANRDHLFDPAVSVPADLDLIRHCLFFALLYLDKTNSGMVLKIDPRDRGTLGLGSSAALAVTVVGGILGLLDPDRFLNVQSPVNRECIYKLAYFTHRWYQQDKGSGIDIATSCFGGLIHYISPKLPDNPVVNLSPSNFRVFVDSPWPHLSVTPLPTDALRHTIIGYTGTHYPTKELIHHFHKTKSQEEACDSFQINSILLSLENLTRQVVHILKTDALDELPELYNQFQLQMETLDSHLGNHILTREIATLIESARKSNCGAKISGAGGGDYVIGCAATSFEKEALLTQWTESGFSAKPLRIDTKGLHRIGN